VAALRSMEQSRLARRHGREGQLPPTPTVLTQLPSQLTPQTLSNALILVDKPRDWQDRDVIRALKWGFRVDTIGHVGSIETLATGLMLVCMGQATRLTPIFHQLDRVYSGTIHLGAATETYDATGRVVETLPWRHISDEDLSAAASHFLGETLLVPPYMTTHKVGGRTFKRTALRDGKEGPLLPQPVYVSEFSVSREPGSKEVAFSIKVGRGGMMRSIAHEFGRVLGSASHLSSLRREAIGEFSVQDAWVMELLMPLLTKYRRSSRQHRQRRAA